MDLLQGSLKSSRRLNEHYFYDIEIVLTCELTSQLSLQDVKTMQNISELEAFTKIS